MKIIKAIIMEFKDGGDIVHLETTLPSSYPNRLKGNLTLAFETEKGKGKEYLEEYFEFITENKNNIEYLNGDK
jgi:acyl CoA:acetate/3-ketoacid CoA transferase beta subunit